MIAGCRIGMGRAALIALSAFAALIAVSWSAPVHAQDDRGVDEDVEIFARVIVAETDLRAGPSVAQRVIYRAERGETFAVQGREASGFWLRVYLDDGRTAYILGDTVETVALDAEEAPSTPGFFAPPLLTEAHGGMAMTAGIFDRQAYTEIKPAIVLGPSIALEPYAGLSLTSAGRGLLFGGGAMVNLAPDWSIAPYVHVGGGGFRFFPNDDAFVPEKRTTFHARAGGGLLLSLRWRILLRLEASNTVLFTADSNTNAQSYVGGLGTYF